MASSTVAREALTTHRNCLEDVQPHMAKASLKKLEDRNFRKDIGGVIVRARSLVGWTQQELSIALAKALRRESFDVAQLSRWEAGTERPHFDTLFAVDEMGWPLVRAFGEMSQKAAIDEGIRRIA